eukprot:scaffold72285_cov63-Phaeocystis_antarctica.AAC.4
MHSFILPNTRSAGYQFAGGKPKPFQAPGAGEPRWQKDAHGLLRHRRGGSAMRRSIAKGASGGAAGCSTATGEKGGAVAGAGRDYQSGCVGHNLRGGGGGDG